MLDRHIVPLQERLLRAPARWLRARHVSANAVSLAGLAMGLVAATLVALGQFHGALICILANRILDGLDGAVARTSGPTERGAFIDIAFDFFFYAAIPFGFALADPSSNALPASALLLSFVGTGSSFLAFAVILAKRGNMSPSFPKKGIYYLGGLTEGFETIVAFILMCLVPTWFPLIAWTFAALAFLTTILRWWWGWRSFAEVEP